jgi:hypothetical protein
MNTCNRCRNLGGLQQTVRRLALPATIIGLGLLVPLSAAAVVVVTNCTEASLRAAMTGGGTITFACDGTITLTNTITNTLDTALDGSGHNVTITGPQAFYVSSNSTLAMVSITIANCQAAHGAGVFNNGGTVNLKNVVFQYNRAGPPYFYPSGPYGGGAILNSAGGRLSATNCTFNWNSAVVPMNSQQPALGGAIYDGGGTVSVQRCVFYGNGTAGAGVNGLPDPGNQSYGGAIYSSGSLSVDSCSFINNSAQGGKGGHYSQGPSSSLGGPGGDAGGGAIYGGTLTISRSFFGSNSASGGFGGDGGDGGTAWTGGAGGNGGSGGGAIGGGVYGVSGVIMNCTFQGNRATAGNGGSGGYGGTSNDPNQTGGPGGNGGNGGNASGGAVAGLNGSLNLANCNCTIAFSSAVAGYGGPSGPGGYGLKGMGKPGAWGTSGSAVAGGANAGAMTNSLLVANSPASSWSGTTDSRHNLQVTNSDPTLGPLTNNGGPTLTMALLPGSPAIDAGDTSAAPFIDQRGFPRPAGSAADIGAFEYGSMLPVLSIEPPSGNVLSVLVQGNSNQWCRLQVSSNLFEWIPLATNQIGPNGILIFQANHNLVEATRFYRVAMP